MTHHGVTGLHVFPNVLHDFVAAAGPETSYPGLRYICSTGQAFPVAVLLVLRRIFPNADILSSYGMTECKRIAYLPDGELDAATGSIGRLLPGLRAYLLDTNGEALPGADQTGELALAGAQLMDGYRNDFAATEKVMLYNIFSESRVLRTGDIFRRDAMGRHWFVGRRDEVFTRRGFQVPPREIERAALSVPGIRDALVVAIPHPVDGPLPGLVVVGPVDPDDQHMAETALRQACGRRLETHMQPHRYLWMDKLPRAESGKICRATGLGESAMELAMAQLLYRDLLTWLHDQGSQAKPVSPRDVKICRARAATLVRLCGSAARRLQDSCGMAVLAEDAPAQGYWRDLQVMFAHSDVRHGISLLNYGRICLDAAKTSIH